MMNNISFIFEGEGDKKNKFKYLLVKVLCVTCDKDGL